MPDDGPYYRLRREGTLYVYDESTREIIDQLIAYNQAIRAQYDQSFGWKLDEEMDLILTSPKQQIANAYATVIPNIKTVWFPSGAAMMEEMSDSSWMLTLAAHETAHLYQLNAKGRFNSGLKSVFGNSFLPFPLFFGIPIWIHPNVMTPTFMVEGNATFLESRLNIGGRLHSGEKRALVLAQIKAGDINPGRLINDDFRFPYGEESYMQGAYFQAHLAAKHGIEKTNRFFVEQGNHYLWPLILNKTFRDNFGNSYPQEIREYVRNMEALAKNQEHTPGLALVETKFAGPMNHDAKKIYFLTTRGVQLPVLHVFDKTTRSLTESQHDLMLGKIFWDGGVPRVASADQHDLHHIEYSLYGEGNKLDPRYRGQIVTDQRAGKTAALDAANSWLDPRILVDGEPYDVGHSTAIFDDSGNVYYFRQNGSERILYRNREPVFKFQGFYAKPMEVTADGTFYFIGSTDYGSTLYQWRGKEIVRVLKSDRVIEARSVSADEFLVTEVNNKGHEVKLAKAERKSQVPAVYSYGFTTQNFIPDKVADREQLKNEERSYNSLREMRYSAFDFAAGYGTSAGFSGLGALTFTDPLEYQSMRAGFAGTQHKDQAALAQYTFTKYLPDFFARYIYERDGWKTVNRRDLRAYDQEVNLGFTVPVLRWRRWDAVLSLAAIYEKNDLHNDPLAPIVLSDDTEETYGTLSSAMLQYQLAPPLGLRPWRYFALGYTNRLETAGGEWTKKFNTSLAETTYIHGFPLEFYGTFNGKAAWAEEPDIKVTGDLPTLSQDIRVTRLTNHNEEYAVKNAVSLKLEVTKVFTLPAYPTRFPVGLSQIAPVVLGQGLFLDDDRENRYPQNTFEWGAGADLHILLAHKIPAVIRYVGAFDTRNPADREDEMRLTFKRSF